MKHLYFKIIVPFFCVLLYSCQDNDDDMFALSNVILELGTSKDEVKSTFSEDVIVEDGNIIYVYNGQNNVVSYQFTNDILSEIAYIIPQTDISQKQITNLIKDAEYLGMLGVGKEIYVHAGKNQIIEIRTTLINDIDYYIFGITAYN